jgi:hypothetical protein
MVSDDTQKTQFEKTQNKTKQNKTKRAQCSNLKTDKKIFKRLYRNKSYGLTTTTTN